MKKLLAATMLMMGMGAGFVLTTPYAEAVQINCAKCSCDMNSGQCDCTDCTIE